MGDLIALDWHHFQSVEEGMKKNDAKGVSA